MIFERRQKTDPDINEKCCPKSGIFLMRDMMLGNGSFRFIFFYTAMSSVVVAVPRSASQPAMPRVPSTNAVDKPVNHQQAPPPTRPSQSENSSPATTPQTETKTGLFSRLFKSKQQDNGAASKAKIGGCCMGVV